MPFLIKPTHLLRGFYFALGVGAAAAAGMATHRAIWRSTASVSRAYGMLPQQVAAADAAAADDPLFGPRARAGLVRRWNSAIDDTLGALAKELARRGV